METGEGCDDGNGLSGDGCSSACAVEPGYVCSGSPSVCSPSGGGSGGLVVCGRIQTGTISVGYDALVSRYTRTASGF